MSQIPDQLLEKTGKGGSRCRDEQEMWESMCRDEAASPEPVSAASIRRSSRKPFVIKFFFFLGGLYLRK